MLFSKLYNKTDELFKKIKEPFVAKKVKRTIESAIDNCIQEVMEEQDRFLKQLEDVAALDLNEFKKSRRKISELQKDVEFLQELYTLLFEKPYEVDALL